MSDLSGQSIGRYHLIEKLGEGGMATVYRALDNRLERDVAIKVIRTELFGPAVLAPLLKRFEREAKTLANMQHPNIVHVMDYGEFENAPFLVMQYLPGGTVKSLTGKPMSFQNAARLLAPIARALAYAHREGIVHRDVKPANILLTIDGNPMLSDFGIAKILESEQSTQLTTTGMTIGTPEYMAPEQWEGNVSPKVDIYALGVILYELVTGRRPYIADTPAAIMIKAAIDPLPRPKEFVPGLPDVVEYVIFRALEKNPAERYASMDEFARALDKLSTLTQPGKPTVTSLSGQTRFSIQANRSGTQETVAEQLTLDEHLFEPRLKKQPQTRAMKPVLWIASTVFIIGLLVTGTIFLNGIFSKTIKPTDTIPVTVETAVPLVVMIPSTTPSMTAFVPTETPTATPKPLEAGDTTTNPADGALLVYIPEGEFTMGSHKRDDPYFWGPEYPPHKVFTGSYWIYSTEVTNRMFSLCAQAGACTTPDPEFKFLPASYSSSDFYKEYPVVRINWDQAQAYCNWAGGQLPTEAEWEKAGRWNDMRLFPWGSQAPTSTMGNFCDKGCPGEWHTSDDDGYPFTAPVGSYPDGKSALGLFDMAGNVYEWAADWYSKEYYATSPSDNPTGPESGAERVLRGGSWYNNVDGERVVMRFKYPQGSLSEMIGFRCIIKK